ncbi:MAG: DUF6232 family protein [Hyphomicrobium sp.]|uniref:DUF6232 family protein n=1 Tax=Hyphomicrobium sp. TaxID=82 RepID=UPI0039E506CE
MVFSGRIKESAAATKTFGSLRIDRRVLSTPTRTIAIANIATVSTGTHVAHRPTAIYWLLTLLFVLMALGSMRPDFTWGPLAPTGATVVLGFLAVVFAGLALRPDDKTHYLLISSSDGVLSRFTAPDRTILEEVRTLLTEKINRGDDSMTFNINFDRGQIENLAGSGPPAALPSPGPDHGQQLPNQTNRPGTGASERGGQMSAGRPRPMAGESTNPPSRPGQRVQPTLSSSLNGNAAPNPAQPESFVDYSGVLPAIVEMHRFYARQTGTQHLEQRLSELELLMRAGTPTISQKTRLRELSGEMSQILGAYPQAVELFDHITNLA